jgi:Nif-specific regulatory protein
MKTNVATSHNLIERLKEIASWVSSVQDLDRLLELILETASSLMNTRASSLLLLDQRTKMLVFKAATGAKKQEIKSFRIKLGQGIAGQVAQRGEPLLIRDVRRDPLWDGAISQALQFETQSIACVPLKIDAKTIGVLEVVDRLDGQPLDTPDLELLTVFSDVAAMAIANARRFERVNRENEDLREEITAKHQIVGQSPALQRVTKEAFKVANSSTSTLILGESGTGKELLAHLIHRASPRQKGPLIVLNCAALQETLLEAELFGYERGAFTGAVRRKIGKFELADGGTIFLDEIGEMSAGMQAKLLRVLQEGVFYRVGGNDSITVDVRVIAATNRDILKEVQEGRFREDLYYRLNIVSIRMPALRERKEDIPLLAAYFIDQFRRERALPHLEITPEAVRKMMDYDWPGNIREMRNALERAVVMGENNRIRPEDLPIFGPPRCDTGLTVGLTLKEALNRFKKEFITLNLDHTGGNRSQAAKIMGIQRTYLSRLISKFDLR